MSRTQISTGVSQRTRAQADELTQKLGYSLRDLVTLAIDRMYQEEIEMNPYQLQAEKRKTHRWLNSLRLQSSGDIEQNHKNYIRELINNSDNVNYLIGLRDLEPADIEAWLGKNEKENALRKNARNFAR